METAQSILNYSIVSMFVYNASAHPPHPLITIFEDLSSALTLSWFAFCTNTVQIDLAAQNSARYFK